MTLPLGLQKQSFHDPFPDEKKCWDVVICYVALKQIVERRREKGGDSINHGLSLNR
jgi:hypothetical protein